LLLLWTAAAVHSCMYVVQLCYVCSRVQGVGGVFVFFFFKQKTAYEILADWSSDVCSSDLTCVSL